MMDKRKLYKKLGRVFLFLFLNLCLTSLIIWIAYNNRTRIKKMMDHDNSFNKEDKVILYDIFSSPLIENGNDLVLPAVNTSDQVVNDVNSSTLPDSLDLMSMYESCRVISTSRYRSDILKIKYVMYNDTLDSYAYFTKTGGKTNTGILYVPGSGDNRPGMVARRQVETEDPTVQATQIHGDIYFPVYPADDIRAIHDGAKMLDIKKILGYLVTNGRNLSLRYLADIFALNKFLDSTYSIRHVWGHSRGGSTATLIGAIVLPDTLIISSGYSVMSNKFFRLNNDQLWWHGADHYFDKNFIVGRLSQSKTQAFFLFGKKEEDDIYGLETKYFYSQNYYKPFQNIHVSYADKKHVWFGEEISKILSGK